MNILLILVMNILVMDIIVMNIESCGGGGYFGGVSIFVKTFLVL